MIILHFHPQPQFIYELFHINFTSVLTECKCEILPKPTISRVPSTAPEIFHIFSILGGKLDTSSVPVDGFDVWDTISIGKPSPRTEILLNIDLAPEEQLYNEME